MNSRKRSNVIVTVSNERPIRDIASDLTSHGMEVDQVLEFTGTLTGTALPDSESNLRAVAGVTDVSPDYPVSMAI